VWERRWVSASAALWANEWASAWAQRSDPPSSSAAAWATELVCLKAYWWAWPWALPMSAALSVSR